MASDENSIIRVSKSAVELHELLSEDDLSLIEIQFSVKQVLRQGVTYEEFIEIASEVLPSPLPVSLSHLKSIFKKIDLYSTGLIDWNGFITYILTALQRDQAASLGVENVLQTSFRVVKGPNHDVIRRIDIMPQYNSNTQEVSYSTYRYVTASKDGVIGVWSQKWKLQKFKICSFQPNVMPKQRIFPWILDMVCLPNVQMIVTCSTDEMIRFYDIINSNMDLIIVITNIHTIVTCLHFWFDPNDLEHSALTFGDSLGSVTFLDFDKSISQKLFGVTTGFGVQKLSLEELSKNQTDGVNVHCFPNLHDEWVRQVRFVPTLKSFLSCSISSTISMCMCTIFLDSSSNRYFVVQKGISSFDYSYFHNIIITGSIDRSLRIWNPYINKKPVAVLSGHSAPVSHVMIIDEKYQAISISEDKCIKVWDLKEQCCLQTVYDRAFKWGNHPIISAIHDVYKRVLIMGSIKVIVIERVWQQDSTDRTLFASHTSPLLGVAFSKVYNYVVSGSDNGAIVFWDIETGQKKVQVPLSHSLLLDGIDVAVAITAMSLDEYGQRLISAGGDGQLKMWSMTNGSFIRSINLPEGKDVNAILACKGRVFFGGWTRRVYVCNDELHLETFKSWPVHHSDDIMALSQVGPSQIGSASWDGKVMIWMLETGQQVSVISLQNQFVFQHIPKLRAMAESQIVGCHAMDIVELASGLRLHDSRRHQENSEIIIHAIEKKSKPRKVHHSVSRRSSFDPEISFPALNSMVSMLTRLDKPAIGSVFVSDTDGFIQLWPIARTGGLVAMFGSVSILEQYTSCMTTDKANKYLFTGDTYGFIRVWYIKYFYSGEIQSGKNKWNKDTKPFPFSKARLKPVRNRVLKELALLKPKDHLKFVNFDQPMLISSFRGHLKTIVQIALVERHQLFVTASKDKSVRMWSYSGAYLRTLGDERDWSLSKSLSVPVLPMDRKAPADIKRVASGPTLQVILQGVSPQWYRLREVILNTYIKSISRKKTAVPEVPKVPEKTVTSIMQRKAQEFIFSQMPSPLGKNFAFKSLKKDKPPLPQISDTYREMNCVYAYLETPPVGTINLDPAYQYLESHRFAAKLKMSTKSLKS